MDGTRYVVPTRLGNAIVVALALGGCRSELSPTATPATDSTAPRAAERTSARLLVAPGAMHGWTCTLEISARLGKPEPDAPFDHISELELEVTSNATYELALQLRKAAARFVFGPVSMTYDVLPDRVVRTDPEQHDVQKADASPQARAVIDAVLGAPHAFVTLDEHAMITAHRNDFGELDAQLGELVGLELAWSLAYPQLPGDVAAGKPWTGTRTVPPIDKRAAQPIEIELEYQLDEVRRGVATIDFAGEKAGSNAAGGATVEIAGRSRVRVADGAFLGGRADVLLDLAIGDAASGFAWRFESECQPPRSG